MRHVNWDLLERKARSLSEDVFARHVDRLTEHPVAIVGRPSPRWEEMTDAEVGDAVGLSEEAVQDLEDRCAPEAPSAPSPARSAPEPSAGGG